MEKLLIIILLLVVLWIIPILRTNLLVISYLQKYFFQIKRFRYFAKSREWLHTFFSLHILAYVFVFLLYAISFFFFHNAFFYPISWILVAILAVDNLVIIYNTYKSRLLYPQVSYMSILLFASVVIIQASIFILWYFYHHFFISAFILLVLPYIIIAVVYIFLQIIFFWWKKKLIKNAFSTLKERSNLVRVWILWNYKTHCSLHLLSHIFGQYPHFKWSSQYNHFVWLLQSLERLHKNDKYLFTERWIYQKWDTVKFCQLLKPNILFITGIDVNNCALFDNRNDILSEYMSFYQYVNQDSTIYIYHDILEHIPKSFWDRLKCRCVVYGEMWNTLDARCYLKNDDYWNTHIFAYNRWNQQYQFHFKSPLKDTSVLAQLAGVLAFYVDQWYKLPDLWPFLSETHINSEFFKEYQTSSGLQVLEYPQSQNFHDIETWLAYSKSYAGAHFLVIDKLSLRRNKKNSIISHIMLGRQLAQYPLDKIFLVNTYYARYIKKWLIAWWFDKNKIYYQGDLWVLRQITKGLVLIRWEDASRMFRKIVLRQ